MAGVKGRSGPPKGNVNGFKHGLSMIEDRRTQRLPRGRDKRDRLALVAELIKDAGGEDRISAAQRLQAELIATDFVWHRKFTEAIARVIRLNPRVAENPKALSVLDGYVRPLINSLAANLQRFGSTRNHHRQKRWTRYSAKTNRTNSRRRAAHVDKPGLTDLLIVNDG